MRKSLVFLLITFGLGACASKYTNKVDFDPSQPLRVIVLPFAELDSHGTIINPKSNKLLIDRVSLISSDFLGTPTQFLRKIAQNELSKSSLDVFPSALVDSELSHHSFAHEDLSIDFDKLYKASPSEICSHLLSCDAVLYGRLRKWDRTYLAIQSISSVALDLKLVARKDNKVLFEASAEDADSRGITKGPTGFSNLVLEPIKGLDNEIISDLARNMVARMLAPLKVGYTEKPLAAPAPVILAAIHDGDGRLPKGGKLTVLAFGSAGLKASFSVGNIAREIPMHERDTMHYVGEYFPLAEDHFANQPIVVTLSDQSGRQSSEQASGGNVTLQ